jgi:hypothetical protein
MIFCSRVVTTVVESKRYSNPEVSRSRDKTVSVSAHDKTLRREMAPLVSHPQLTLALPASAHMVYYVRGSKAFTA